MYPAKKKLEIFWRKREKKVPKRHPMAYIFNVTMQKPSVESIEKVFVSVQILSKRIINTPSAIPENAEGTRLTGKKLIVEGLLQQKLIYTADNPNEFCIDVCVEDVFVKMMDSRTIFKNVTLLLNARPIVAPC